MADFYKYPPRKPRTIDVLEIGDCWEIIVTDLKRYGVPEELAVKIMTEYFIPLKQITDKFKLEYGNRCFKGSPESAFFD